MRQNFISITFPIRLQPLIPSSLQDSARVKTFSDNFEHDDVVDAKETAHSIHHIPQHFPPVLRMFLWRYLKPAICRQTPQDIYTLSSITVMFRTSHSNKWMDYIIGNVNVLCIRYDFLNYLRWIIIFSSVAIGADRRHVECLILVNVVESGKALLSDSSG